MRQSSILDPIHDTLPADLWLHPGSPEPVLRPEHARWITHFIHSVLERGGYSDPQDWLHLVLTGSLTTFQYSPTSDCDVSLFVDSQHLPEWSRAEMIGLMIEHTDGVKLPGTPYEMQCYVVAKGLAPHDLYKPGLRSGYDIGQGKWIEPPDPNRVHDVKAEENGFYVWAMEQADKMERLLRYEPDKAVDFWHQIHRKRQRDQTAGKGDYSESNIIYKFLANRGLFPQIAEASGEHVGRISQRPPRWSEDDQQWSPEWDDEQWPHDWQQAPDHSNGFGYQPMVEEPLDQPLNQRMAAPLPKSKIPIGQMTPEQRAEYQAAQERARIDSLNWLRDNPRSPENIVSHWHQTTPEHRAQGMSWYQDANQAARQIAQDRGITVNQAAGLIANYSPQQHWATNLEMASRAAAGELIGGPKQPGQRGFMASRSQADVAARILNGEDYHDIFRGKKIASFGHLIEHGQDTDPNNPMVVVDRHALGVAHGGYADDGVYIHSKVSAGVRRDGSSPVYDEVANMYKQAADIINVGGGYDGVPVQPHQLQAATWLTRQRLNAEGGYSDTNPAVAERTRKVAEGSIRNWNAYAAENHPTLVGQIPGTGFSAQTGAGVGLEPAFAKTAAEQPISAFIHPDYLAWRHLPEEKYEPQRFAAWGDHQSVLDANAGQDLQGLPGAVKVPNVGPLQFHSNADIQRIANEYNAANGLDAHPTDYSSVNPEVGQRIAQEYERMQHNPQDPQVAAAYDALARETRAQYDAAVRNGYQFEFYPEHDPYPNSPREAVLDLHHNKHMYVYPTAAGYGQEGQGQPMNHPLLGDSGVRWNGQPVTHNDLFRAVHDFYGHAKEGLGFRALGEDNAYRQHAAMFSPLARRALTSETRGQNSWVNYGPYGQQNQNASQGNTVYAEQKAGLLPEWVSDPNLHTQGLPAFSP